MVVDSAFLRPVKDDLRPKGFPNRWRVSRAGWGYQLIGRFGCESNGARRVRRTDRRTDRRRGRRIRAAASRGEPQEQKTGVDQPLRRQWLQLTACQLPGLFSSGSNRFDIRGGRGLGEKRPPRSSAQPSLPCGWCHRICVHTYLGATAFDTACTCAQGALCGIGNLWGQGGIYRAYVPPPLFSSIMMTASFLLFFSSATDWPHRALVPVQTVSLLRDQVLQREVPALTTG